MIKFIKKIKNGITNFFYGFFGGMKIVSDEVFTQVSNKDGKGITINKQIHQDRVSKDLLAGQETRQVQELRYRTYRVDRESQNYTVFSPYLAMNKNSEDFPEYSKYVKILNNEDLPVKLIQENFEQVETIKEGLNRVDNGVMNIKHRHWITILRENLSFIPRYKIEDYAKKVVIRELEEGRFALIDFYVSKYPNSDILLSKGFVREVEAVKDKAYRSEILVFDKIRFETLNAYNKTDMLLYEFIHPWFKEVVEFDGYYVLTFKCQYLIDGKDLTDKYHSDSMATKYEKKAAKERSSNFDDYRYEDTFVCEECGKEVRFDPNSIDEMDIKDDPSDSRNLEYFDLQVAEQTYGKKLCMDCLRKKIKNEL